MFLRPVGLKHGARKGPMLIWVTEKKVLQVIGGYFRLIFTANTVATRYTNFYLRSVINSPYVF
jgi:hypothetical protein